MHTALAQRGIRFALAGAAVALLYLLVTTGLHDALSVPFQVALLCGFATAVAAHFTLQRTFVWTHPAGYALSAHHQAGRYLASLHFNTARPRQRRHCCQGHSA